MTTQHLTIRQRSITPLVDIQSTEFAEQYELGLTWAMYGEREDDRPVPASYLILNLRSYEERGYFERHQWLEHIGFFLGMIHGAVLSPQTGQLRPDVTTLVDIKHPQFKRGYQVGREACFHEGKAPRTDRLTERYVIDWLCELVTENPYHEGDHLDTWYYCTGDLVGNLSVQLFPETEQERQRWRKEEEAHRKRKQAMQQHQRAQQQRTEPLRSPILQEA